MVSVKRNVDKNQVLVAAKDFSKGELQLPYTGELCTRDMYDERRAVLDADAQPHYFMDSGHGGVIIDARNIGNVTRFASHSCMPNCVVERKLIFGMDTCVLINTRDIKMGEEVTFDYFAGYSAETRSSMAGHSAKGWLCKCGSSVCMDDDYNAAMATFSSDDDDDDASETSEREGPPTQNLSQELIHLSQSPEDAPYLMDTSLSTKQLIERASTQGGDSANFDGVIRLEAVVLSAAMETNNTPPDRVPFGNTPSDDMAFRREVDRLFPSSQGMEVDVLHTNNHTTRSDTGADEEVTQNMDCDSEEGVQLMKRNISSVASVDSDVCSINIGEDQAHLLRTLTEEDPKPDIYFDPVRNIFVCMHTKKKAVFLFPNTKEWRRLQKANEQKKKGQDLEDEEPPKVGQKRYRVNDDST
jgi:hypothetical protein